MKASLSHLSIVLCLGLWLCAANQSQASINISSGLGTTHAGNLVVNGSFEIGAPADGLGNANFWADPSLTPYAVPPSWKGMGVGSTAVWGNDGPTPYRLKFSDVLPDGRVAVDFRNSTNVFVSQPPTFLPSGEVTFPAPPVFASVTGVPAILQQTVPTHLTPVPSYNLSFWISGEENSTNQGFTGAGIIGLRVTNVLPGDPIQWLAVPNSVAYGMSKLYEFQFSPLNSSQPVNVAFINWGGLNLTPYGGSAFGTQPILDDVIINAVIPEPASISLFAIGAISLWMFSRRRHIG